MFAISHYNNSGSRSERRTVSEACCSTLRSLKTRVFDVGAAAFSGIGNWPFYGVAASFGNKYSAGLGSFLGGCEFASYFAFRISNFKEIRQKFVGNVNGDIAALLPLPRVEGEEGAAEEGRGASSAGWQDVAKKTAIAGLGIIAQFPIMVLVYYANGENLFYPVITGACEASFTILSLLMSLQSDQGAGREVDAELAGKRDVLVEQIDRFIEELPSKYDDAEFARKIQAIFSNEAVRSDETRGKELLDLIFEARGLPVLDKGRYDGAMKKVAMGVGGLIAAYLTVLNGTVSYKGILAWKPEQEILAAAAAAFVSLANIKLLGKFCIDSAKGYYEGLRDVVRGQYRRPLAAAVAPRQWLAGRIVSTVLSWSSFGTTAVSARDYVPQIGNALIGPAPLSSALLLNDNLNGSADEIVMWANSGNEKAKRFVHIQKTLLAVKEMLQNADSGSLQRYLALVQHPLQELEPRAIAAAGDKTPLLLRGATGFA